MESQELINHVAQSARDNFSHAIFPIYKFVDMADPIFIGTCFSFEYQERRFLVTAAHVLDHNIGGSLGFDSIASKHPVEISGAWHTTDPGDARDDDPLDFAWHELIPTESQSVPFIAAEHIEDAQSSGDGLRLLTAIGFPVSKNKKISPAAKAKKRLSPKRAVYSNTEVVPADYFKSRSMSARTHVAMKREKRSIDEEGGAVNTIGHRGLSGGPLIYSGLTDSPVRIGGQKVIGVILEGSEELDLLVALRMSVVLRHIDRVGAPPVSADNDLSTCGDTSTQEFK